MHVCETLLIALYRLSIWNKFVMVVWVNHEQDCLILPELLLSKLGINGVGWQAKEAWSWQKNEQDSKKTRFDSSLPLETNRIFVVELSESLNPTTLVY